MLVSGERAVKQQFLKQYLRNRLNWCTKTCSLTALGGEIFASRACTSTSAGSVYDWQQTRTQIMKILSSLRSQLLVPLLVGSMLVAVVVALSAYWVAESRAKAETRERLISIKNVLSEASFPLTQNVMQMLAGLTDAYWVKLNAQKEILEFAVPTPSSVGPESEQLTGKELAKAEVLESPSEFVKVLVGGNAYSGVLMKDQGGRMAISSLPRYDLLVMLDDSRAARAVTQAALPPLLTGLATILLLGSLSLILAERLVKRIAGVQKEVDRIAVGNFDLPVSNAPHDEIDKLSYALKAMSNRLEQMWSALRRNHAQQLINQIAAGLAHNLRNTLTGARLAVELIDQDCSTARTMEGNASGSVSKPVQNSALKVAIDQIKVAEQYIQRLLWMARGRESAQPKPIRILDGLTSLRDGLEPTARHRCVEMNWDFDSSLNELWVANESALLSAVSNLVWNAIEAANRVSVKAATIQVNGPQEVTCIIEVIDLGPGPPPEIQLSLFEPFVSGRPEGIGLGLPLVRQSVELLGGSVEWEHRDGKTTFKVQFPTLRKSSDSRSL